MKSASRHLPLYLSAPHPCSYLEDRQSSTLFVDPAAELDMRSYGELLKFGFRRSGRIIYTPRCEFCAQCISVRVPVNDFSPRRGHRRILRANRDIRVTERPARFDEQHYALYQQYTQVRHQDGEMADASQEEYLSFLTADWSETVFLEFRLHGRLAAIAVTDVAVDAWSAVYTFFDPSLAKRSLGSLAILRQIELVRESGLEHLYLGYWIRDSRKMAYKIGYRPIEVWYEGRWQRLNPGEVAPI